MRVPVITGNDRNQEGAVAIMVAVLIIVLVGMAAFAVDGGVAYNSKRQLQTSADAASLAGAAVYLEQPGDCHALEGDSGLEVDSQKAAENIMADNHPTATMTDFSVDCVPNTPDGRITVTFANEATIDTQFGSVLGVDTMTPVARAVANIGERQGQGLRPVALCKTEVPAVMPNQARVGFNGHHTDEPCDGNPGNWRELDCPETENSGTPAYVAAINHGCSSLVHPVPHEPPFAGDADLDDHLLAACPAPGDSNEVCLSGNTGLAFNAQVYDAWVGLLDESIHVPIVCGPVDCPDHGAFDETGTNARYPLYQIAEVVVCGVNGGNPSTPATYGTVAACTDAALQAGDAGDPWLVLSFQNLIEHDDPDPVVGASESVQLVE